MPWLRLLRVPNLLTVPGDVLSGFFLAMVSLRACGVDVSVSQFVPALALCLCASLCLYAAGLVFNDVADLAVDAVERPSRPLPSGAIGRRAASMAGVCFVLAGLAAARFAGECSLDAEGACSAPALFAGTPAELPLSPALLAAAALAVAACVYDIPAVCRRFAFPAVALMGVCRGLDVLLGAALLVPLAAGRGLDPVQAFGTPAAGALAVAAYVAAFSLCARGEASAPGPAPSRKMYLPAAALVLTLLPAVVMALLAQQDPAESFSAGGLPVRTVQVARLLPVFALAIALLHALVLARFYARHVPVPEVAGRFIGNLPRVQAALVLCAWSCDAALVTGFVLFFLPVPFLRLAGRFPSS